MSFVTRKMIYDIGSTDPELRDKVNIFSNVSLDYE